jgi:hypothetical protein
MMMMVMMMAIVAVAMRFFDPTNFVEFFAISIALSSPIANNDSFHYSHEVKKNTSFRVR